MNFKLVSFEKLRKRKLSNQIWSIYVWLNGRDEHIFYHSEKKNYFQLSVPLSNMFLYFEASKLDERSRKTY